MRLVEGGVAKSAIQGKSDSKVKSTCLGVCRVGRRARPAGGFGTFDGREEDFFLVREVGCQLSRHPVERGCDPEELGVLVAVHVGDPSRVGAGLGRVRPHEAMMGRLDVVDEARRGPVGRVLLAHAPPRWAGMALGTFPPTAGPQA